MELSFKQTKISIICGRGGKTNLVCTRCREQYVVSSRNLETETFAKVEKYGIFKIFYINKKEISF